MIELFFMKSILVNKKFIVKALKTRPKKGKNLLEPFSTWSIKNNLPFNIIEDNEVLNNAERHKHEGDLWLCLVGKVDFICGGKMINELAVQNSNGNNSQADHIRGGKKVTLKSGDWLWIPPGEPHQHSSKSLSRLIIIKIPKN